MRKRLSLVALLFALFLLNACQTTATIKTNDLVTSREPVRVNPVNVQADFITTQAISPQALDVSIGNLFDNSGFENVLEGWTGCSASAIKHSGDAFEGSGALEIIPNNCFFRSAEVSSNQDLVLSCYIKITEGSGWTGMGMGFSDSTYTTISESPTTVATSNDYVRYDVTATTPANTKFASMWIFSENKAVVDNCSLILEATPPPPPPPSGDNLLENGGFETLSGATPTEWSIGCGGSATSVTGREGEGFNLTGGVCVDQGLSAGDVAALSGNEYTYSCYAKNTGGYASLSIFLDDAPVSTIIPVSNTYQLVELKGTAPQASSGFVSIYSEGDLTVDDCVITTGDVVPLPPPPPSGENLLENGGFNQVGISAPDDWNVGCSGFYESVQGDGSAARLGNGVCMDQSLSSSDLAALAGQQYTFSCQTRNSGGFASISVFFDGTPVSVVIPENPPVSLVQVTGIAPTANTGFVSIYSEADLTIDNCSLTIEDVQPVTCVDPVNIPDPNLRFRLNRTAPPTCADLLSRTELSVFPPPGANFPVDQRITSLEGLQFATNLTSISLSSNIELSDISQLATLIQLTAIDFTNNSISDISPLANLTDLEGVALGGNQISDIEVLSGLTNLEFVSLGSNPLSDISVLENLTNLQEVNIGSTLVTDISPLLNNPGISQGDTVVLPPNNNISPTDIQTLRDRGVTVRP